MDKRKLLTRGISLTVADGFEHLGSGDTPDFIRTVRDDIRSGCKVLKREYFYLKESGYISGRMGKERYDRAPEYGEVKTTFGLSKQGRSIRLSDSDLEAIPAYFDYECAKHM